MLQIQGYSDFSTASRAVLRFLHERLGFDLWMLTRVSGDDWIVLEAEDYGYGVKEGDVFHWADSFCSQMVKGYGPCIAPVSDQIPAYFKAPINQQVKIGAYIGMPLTCSEGQLFGTLCAIHPEPLPEEITLEFPLVEVLARLLSSLLTAELKAQEHLRRAERAEMESLIDALTGLYNRRGWTNLLEIEEQRCRRYGHSACVIVIDVDNLKETNDTFGHVAGDQLLKRLATVLKTVLRQEDVAARVGGDEFTVLAVETDLEGAQQLLQRLKAAFAAADIQASVGYEVRVPSQSLAIAWEKADMAMYRQKKARQRNCWA